MTERLEVIEQSKKEAMGKISQRDDAKNDNHACQTKIACGFRLILLLTLLTTLRLESMNTMSRFNNDLLGGLKTDFPSELSTIEGRSR